MKKIKFVLKAFAVIFLASMAHARFEPVRTGVQFVEGDDAVNEILGGSNAPCVPKFPAWEFIFGDATFSRFSVDKLGVDCREELTEAVRSLSDYEKDMLTKYVVLIDNIIDADFPALNSFPWSFAAISDSSDFGVPVSRDHIVLTKDLLEEMLVWQTHKSNMFFVGMEILVHEKIRLLQARHPQYFEKFFSDVWGFKKIGELPQGELMRENGFNFSPALPNEWAIKVSPRASREYIMPALLLRDAGRSGTTMQRVAIVYDSTANGFVPREGRRAPIEFRELWQVVAYRRRFSQTDIDYHPFELSANLAAKYLVMKFVSAQYGTPLTRRANFSQIDVLINSMQ